MQTASKEPTTKAVMKSHIFGDASEKAHAVAIYVSSITPKVSFQTSLVMAKTCVTSMKGMNIPILELNGALIHLSLTDNSN